MTKQPNILMIVTDQGYLEVVQEHFAALAAAIAAVFAASFAEDIAAGARAWVRRGHDG